MDATARLIAIVVLASFATERILAATTYLLNADRVRLLRHESGVKLRARVQPRERRKVLLLALGGAIALAVVDAASLRILELLGPANVAWPLDYWLTWLVLFAGADRIRELLQGVKSERAPEKKDIPIFRLDVEGSEPRKLSRAS